MKSFSTEIQPDDHILIDLFVQESAGAKALRKETERDVAYAHMMSTPQQAAYLAFLIRVLQAVRVLEIGVFTGYSTLVMAEALPADGIIIACDHSEDWTTLAKKHWAAAGVLDRITLYCANALETLEFLRTEQGQDVFDLIFIDADKIHYAQYYEYAVSLLRPGGVIVLDNVIQINSNRVVQGELPATRAVKALLIQISQDARVSATLLPLAEGMLLVQKK